MFIFITIYRGTFAFYFGGRCRFTPSCSCYAQEALQTHSAFTATKLISIRLFKCHPLGPYGYDPVPINPARDINFEEKTA